MLEIGKGESLKRGVLACGCDIGEVSGGDELCCVFGLIACALCFSVVRNCLIFTPLADQRGRSGEKKPEHGESSASDLSLV